MGADLSVAYFVRADLTKADFTGADLTGADFTSGIFIDAGLTETAQLEALSIAVQARTAAVMEVGLHLDTGLATGTGTDCAALACDPGEGRYAGLHTALGEAIGAATRQAVAAAAADWILWRDAERIRRAGA